MLQPGYLIRGFFAVFPDALQEVTVLYIIMFHKWHHFSMRYLHFRCQKKTSGENALWSDMWESHIISVFPPTSLTFAASEKRTEHPTACQKQLETSCDGQIFWELQYHSRCETGCKNKPKSCCILHNMVQISVYKMLYGLEQHVLTSSAHICLITCGQEILR